MLASMSDLQHDKFSFNLRMALESGAPRSGALDILKLARDGSSSSNIVENAHGHGAQQMKHHWTFCERSLQARGLITSVQGAFRKSREEVAFAKAAGKVERLEAKVASSRFAGRQLLLTEMAAQDRVML